MEREFISIEEAGRRFLGVSRNTAYKYANDGTIPCVKIGGKRKVDVAQMEARATEIMNGQATAKDEFLKLVTDNLGIIEFALLGLANSEDIGHHIRMEPADVARLADALREAYERCAP